jgi:hypothetical protein
VSFLFAGAGEVSLMLEPWDVCASMPVVPFVKEFLPLLTAKPACPEVQCLLKRKVLI